jgi:hypothetical protein
LTSGKVYSEAGIRAKIGPARRPEVSSQRSHRRGRDLVRSLDQE